jgi:hypothetical protein
MKYAIKSVIKSGLSAFGIKIYRNRGGGIGKIVGFFGDIRAAALRHAVLFMLARIGATSTGLTQRQLRNA